jgi:6-phosphogluconolactonase
VWDDGSLVPASSSIPQGPNAHQVVVAPRTGGFALLVPCLGSDTIAVNIVGGEGNPACPLPGSICPASTAQSRPGSGPRHVVFHPSLPSVVYAINEKDSSIATWTFDPTTPALLNPTYVSALPPGVQPNASLWAAGEIAVSADGRTLYASNRALSSAAGTSSIAAFRLAPNGAIAEPIGWYDGGGDVRFPRHFSLTPDGQWMLVANQQGKSMTVFAVGADGSLSKVATTPTGGNNPAFVFALPGLVPNPNPASGEKTRSRLAVTTLAAAMAAAVALIGGAGGVSSASRSTSSSRGGLSLLVAGLAAVTAGIAALSR